MSKETTTHIKALSKVQKDLKHAKKDDKEPSESMPISLQCMTLSRHLWQAMVLPTVTR